MSTIKSAKLADEITKAIKLLGESHTLCIIGNLNNGPMRFSELQRAIVINPTTLSDRLDRLEKDGIIIRQEETVDKISVVYELTDKGRAVVPIIDEFGTFADKFLK